MTTPDWMSQRGGELKQSRDQRSWSVYFNGEPLYLVMPLPAKGTFSCRVSQTNNGKRLDSGATYPTWEEAGKGGIEELRKALGW